MLRIAGWAAAVALAALLLWQATAPEPLLPHGASALLLLLIGVLAGLRISTDSAAAYIKDLQRLNKLMADQQRDLEEANWMLLKRANSETAAPPERS
jgi:hypothetical protein